MDEAIFQFFHNLVGQSSILDLLGIFLAKYLTYFLVLASLLFFLKEKDLKKRIFIFAFTVLTVIIARGIFTELIRFFYNRPRPFLALNFEPLIPESGAGFPSGHASFLFGLVFPIFYFNRKFGAWFLVSSLLVGLGRVFVGVHYPGDILGGIFVALIAYLIVQSILIKYNPVHKQEVINPANLN